MTVASVNHKPGTLGTLSGLVVGKKVASADFPDYAKWLGTEIVGPRGEKYRLVQLNVAAGVAVPQYLAFANSTPTTDLTRNFDVELAVRGGAKPTNRVCGYAIEGQVALVDNDIFWLQFDGPEIAGYIGDDNTDVAVGDYLNLDDDADKGKLYGVGTTFSAEFTQGVALDANTGVDQLVRFIPIKPFRG
jgi:hypothetical protein